MEIWKDVKFHEGLYQVSNLGNVKSLNYNHTGKELILKTVLCGYYLTVCLHKKGKQKTKRVHQLVAEAFLEYNPDGTQKLVVNHKDNENPNNKLDNRVENLEIITNRENTNQKHLKSSSQYTGVSWHKNRNKWTAQIFINKKLKHLGCFSNEIEAHNAYQKALCEL